MPTPTVRAVPVRRPDLDAGHLPGEHFADAYAVAVPAGTTARALAAAVFASPPRWAATLMAIRNLVVAPLGLVATPARVARAAAAANGTGERLGMFPVLADAPGELVLGLDDRHLDFRVSVAVRVADDGPEGVVTTRVRFHGALGRAYFVPVRPVHRLLVPALLRRAARWLAAEPGV